MWHCPHCGAPQAEAARCWVCRRSSTTCSTCRHFRTSLAGDVGYCGNDRRRAPLTGRELRSCWEDSGRTAHALPTPGHAPRGHSTGDPRALVTTRGDGGPLDRPDPMRLRGFVPLDELVAAPAPESATEPLDEVGRTTEIPPAVPALPPALLSDAPDRWETRTTLFGETEG